ncbi:MAG TPA: formate C-acetyltransferase/glycerol dehydratase family glycyl radical enzyme [Bacteroidales bacterium]|nr:MAG: glycyl radical enzyme [Bacteroidetes bacterium GWE2_42_24]OFY26110.1 MAG: glycyl radical enzyme [Bacteroidetes bacterium GWF2_43_11]HAQ65295.1 formate C-acetyltransferase/glycerol dehydratase family glycyl radical enzyme [Bacteroidales bacterium]HBZ65371.1 formate C-acetyltransferase/glycerol dehydratase family glycyl radical enzyme [Bacteroidales bacterium]
MTERVNKLRRQSLDAINCISAERALIVTRFHQSDAAREVSAPVRRGRCLMYLLNNKTICINPGELIVGERGPAPKATSTYPEVTLHSLEDLDVLHNRAKVSFKSDEAVREAYRDVIIPFWQGKTHRDKMMGNMTSEWKAAYDAGIFTEFQEQRAPGHTVLGKKMWSKGLLDIIDDIEKSRASLDFFNDPQAFEKQEELAGMELAASALIRYSERHAEELVQLAQAETDDKRKKELEQMAAVCRRVPAHKPETLHEALQHYWFIHLGVITELNPWDSFNPGRLDQHLLPFYQQDLASGRLTKEEARELLHCFWIKFNNHPAPPKIGVTALESNTYTDFSLINLGGVKEDGSDAVNEMTYLLLEVIQEMRLLQPSSMIQVSKKNPDRFIHKTLNIIRTGFGQPSIFNTDAIVQELMRQGKTPEDARNGGASGCVESGAFGTEAYILTGYFNLTKIFELTLHDGFDPRTGRQVGLHTGEADKFSTFNLMMEAFEKQVNYFVDIKIRGNNVIEKLFAINLPVPFLSLLIDDCIANGCDYNAGGTRYNSSYIQGVGLGSLTDSLTAIKQHVYDQQTITMKGMIQALDSNFQDYQELRKELVFNTPKWGNDDDTADRHAIGIFNLFFKAVDGRQSPRGATYRINMLPTTCHIYFGQVTGATPDGRLSGIPLSEGISPVQGADHCGPTAVLKSAAKIDHIKTGGTLLNQKFTPSFFDDNESYGKLTALIRSYFRMDGHHIQFNVVNADTLRDAQKHPEKYRDLIVRVAGYSDYFNDLGEDLQDEIIRRTEHSDC